jgi:methionine biosynthesis protein MetW
MSQDCPGNSANSDKSSYALGLSLCPLPEHAHHKFLHLVAPGSRVLELGCASGFLSEQLKNMGCTVYGVEIDEEAARMAGRHCQEVLSADVDSLTSLPWEPESFDVVLCADVLEHLKNARRALDLLRPYLKDTGMLIVSVPNIANYGVRLLLLRGKFEYVRYGILDNTHLHFFTLQSIQRLLREAGFEIVARDQTPGLGNSGVYQLILGRLLRVLRLERPLGVLLARWFPTLFAFQFILVARPHRDAAKQARD